MGRIETLTFNTTIIRVLHTSHPRCVTTPQIVQAPMFFFNYDFNSIYKLHTLIYTLLEMADRRVRQKFDQFQILDLTNYLQDKILQELNLSTSELLSAHAGLHNKRFRAIIEREFRRRVLHNIAVESDGNLNFWRHAYIVVDAFLHRVQDVFILDPPNKTFGQYCMVVLEEDKLILGTRTTEKSILRPIRNFLNRVPRTYDTGDATAYTFHYQAEEVDQLRTDVVKLMIMLIHNYGYTLRPIGTSLKIRSCINVCDVCLEQKATLKCLDCALQFCSEKCHVINF